MSHDSSSTGQENTSGLPFLLVFSHQRVHRLVGRFPIVVVVAQQEKTKKCPLTRSLAIATKNYVWS
jgi:hypothetical protein